MNQQTIKEKEEVVGEAAEPRTIKETPLQGTKAASKQQLCATGKKKVLRAISNTTILTLWPSKLRRFAVNGTTYGQADSVLTRTSVSPSSDRCHGDATSFPFFH
jgi:hypothetical protein